MYLNYFNETTNIKDIPEKYLTREMVNFRFNREPTIFYAPSIPEQFLTLEMFLSSSSFYKVPEHLRTQKTYNRIYKKTKDTTLIPIEFITPEMN